MEEGKACALLKLRFEEAGFHIEENRTFDEAGVRFEIDGFDAKHRVGYEYVTREAGDDWDVDGDVIAALAARRNAGELYVLVVDETAAPNAAALEGAVDGFLAELHDAGVIKKPAAAAKPAKRAKPKTAAPPAKKAARAPRATKR